MLQIMCAMSQGMCAMLQGICKVARNFSMIQNMHIMRQRIYVMLRGVSSRQGTCIMIKNNLCHSTRNVHHAIEMYPVAKELVL